MKRTARIGIIAGLVALLSGISSNAQSPSNLHHNNAITYDWWKIGAQTIQDPRTRAAVGAFSEISGNMERMGAVDEAIENQVQKQRTERAEQQKSELQANYPQFPKPRVVDMREEMRSLYPISKIRNALGETCFLGIDMDLDGRITKEEILASNRNVYDLRDKLFTFASITNNTTQEIKYRTKIGRVVIINGNTLLQIVAEGNERTVPAGENNGMYVPLDTKRLGRGDYGLLLEKGDKVILKKYFSIE
jgi:hypothetical protein